MSIHTMAIAHCEEMDTLHAIVVGYKDKTILVLFERIAWDIPYCSRKGKLCYDVTSLILSLNRSRYCVLLHKVSLRSCLCFLQLVSELLDTV